MFLTQFCNRLVLRNRTHRLKLGEEKHLVPVYEPDEGAFSCPEGCGWKPPQLLDLLCANSEGSGRSLTELWCWLSKSKFQTSSLTAYDRAHKLWRHKATECWPKRETLQAPMQPDQDPNAPPVGLLFAPVFRMGRQSLNTGLE